MAPESLSILIQRSGRAGRQPGLQARAILLIQPSAFHEKGKSARKAGEPVEYVKQLEPGLRLYVEVPPGLCRRDVLDEYFDNPPRNMSKWLCQSYYEPSLNRRVWGRANWDLLRQLREWYSQHCARSAYSYCDCTNVWPTPGCWSCMAFSCASKTGGRLP